MKKNELKQIIREVLKEQESQLDLIIPGRKKKIGREGIKLNTRLDVDQIRFLTGKGNYRVDYKYDDGFDIKSAVPIKITVLSRPPFHNAYVLEDKNKKHAVVWM